RGDGPARRPRGRRAGGARPSVDPRLDPGRRLHVRHRHRAPRTEVLIPEWPIRAMSPRPGPAQNRWMLLEREHQLATLGEYAAEARDEGRLVLVSGEAG